MKELAATVILMISIVFTLVTLEDLLEYFNSRLHTQALTNTSRLILYIVIAGLWSFYFTYLI